MEIINFIFSGFWHFVGSMILLLIISEAIETVVKSVCDMIPKLIHGQHDNFYIGAGDLTGQVLDKIKEAKKEAKKEVKKNESPN